MTSFSLRPNPLHLLAVAAVGFAGWVVYDATRTRDNRPDEQPPPPAPRFEVISANKRFATLRPGMPQPVVEEMLRGVATVEVGPVEVSGGEAVYRSRHQLHLLQPLPQAEAVGRFIPGPHIVTLVFDARAAGHPLVRVVTESAPVPMLVAD